MNSDSLAGQVPPVADDSASTPQRRRMLHLVHQVINTPVRALDGEIGFLDDCLVEPSRWVVRYVVVRTGDWLEARRVLLSPMSIAAPWGRSGIQLLVKQAQVAEAPPLVQSAFGRQEESTLLQFYGQPYYWGGSNVWGMFDTPAQLVSASPSGQPDFVAEDGTEDLRSIEETVGYHIAAADGEIGHVDDFLIDEQSWRIRHLVVDTSNWIGGRSVVVSTTAVERIDRDRRVLHVRQSRDEIRRSLSFDAVIDTLDPAETGPPFSFI